MTNVAVTKRSKNAKVGPIPVTTSSKSTCPPSCKLRWSNEKSACYAEAGFHTRMHWDKVTSGERGTDWSTFIEWVEGLPENQKWRHNVAGDLPGREDGLDADAVSALIQAAKHTRGFTYTHYPHSQQNDRLLHTAAQQGFTINKSTDNIAEAYKSYKRGLPTVTLMPSGDDSWRKVEHKGMKVVRCPAEYIDTSCDRCMMCASGSPRRPVIGFTVHGTRAKQADVIARG